MTKEIRQYIKEIEAFLNDTEFNGDWGQISKEMLIRIGFYQHERLIHLIVTVVFAVITIMVFYMFLSLSNIMLIWLLTLLIIMDIPYTAHYYFLENSVQKLYRLYYDVKDKAV